MRLAPLAGAVLALLAPAPSRSLLPESTDFVLDNGMRVILVPDHEVPLVSFDLRVAGGSVEDPPGREGTAALLADLLTRGAGERDAARFADDVEFAGGAFAASAAARWTGVSCEFLARDTDLALDLLRDVVTRPRLDASEFERARGLALDTLSSEREEPQEVIGRYATTWLFGAHAYGRPVAGSEESVAAVSLDDVRAAARRQLAPHRAWLAVGGDFDPAALRKRIEERFGGWSAESAPAAPVPAWTGTEGGRVLLVDKPDALQTYFQFGNEGFDYHDPDYAARWLANTILGGRFTSRLNRVLRTERGLTYGASSWFDDDRGGLFVVSTYTETARTGECVTLAAQLYREFRENGLTQEELDSARKYVEGQFGPSAVETGAQQAAMLLQLDFDHVPRDVVGRVFERFDALTLEEVNRVVRRFPEKLDWVVIGRAEAVRPIVERLGTVTECAITDPGWGPRPG